MKLWSGRLEFLPSCFCIYTASIKSIFPHTVVIYQSSLLGIFFEVQACVLARFSQTCSSFATWSLLVLRLKMWWTSIWGADTLRWEQSQSSYRFQSRFFARAVSCLTARSAIISSLPPPTTCKPRQCKISSMHSATWLTIILKSRLICSIEAPSPPLWYPAPLRTCWALRLAISRMRPPWALDNAIWPAISGTCHPNGDFWIW